MAQDNLPNKILIVDDDASVAQGLEEQLSRYEIRVEKATTLESAFYLFNQNRFEVVLIELEFGPMPGVALVQKWREHEKADRRAVGFILMSGNTSHGKNDGLVRELGDLEVLKKPFGLPQLLPYLSRGLATFKRRQAYEETQTKIVNYYEKSGNFDKAAEEVQKRIQELGPKGLEMLSDLYERGERYEDALKIVDSMLEKDPQNTALLNQKARMLMKLGRYKEAKPYLEKCDEAAPQNIARLNDMASMYLHMKEPEQSISKFKELLELNPDDPEMKFSMFAKLYEHGYDQHAVEFGRNHAKPMEIVRHYNNKGVLLSKEGDREGAVKEYERALQFYPKFRENYRIHFNIALAALQRKDREGAEQAVKSLKKCLELKPDFEKAKSTLERVETALNKDREPEKSEEGSDLDFSEDAG